eukprot:5219498-Pyramimonas_sp.AAC.1
MEAQLVAVRDIGTVAVRTLRDELLMVRQTTPMGAHGSTDSRLRNDSDTLRNQVQSHAAALHSTRTSLTSEIDGKLRGAETALHS